MAVIESTSADPDSLEDRLSATLNEYDALGQLVFTGRDLNGNGSLDRASLEPIQESSVSFWKGSPAAGIATGWWRRQTGSLYPVTNSADVLTNSVQYSRLSGFASGVRSESLSLDIHDNLTRQWTEIDRGNRKREDKTETPASSTIAIRRAVNGRLVWDRSHSGLEHTYAHDAFGRRLAVTDPRTGASTNAYNSIGQLAWSEDAAGHRTHYTYDNLGRRVAVSNALGQVTHSAYDTEGRLSATWGATYPVAYEYDDFGRMSAMATTRDSQHESVNLLTLLPQGLTLSDVSDPSYPSDLDTTRWNYDEATGLLEEKLYADGKGPSYTYTADGKLATRTWERENQTLVTTYGYDGQGRLTSVSYNPDATYATSDVTYTYDRLGRQTEIVQDAVSGAPFGFPPATRRTFTYSSQHLGLLSETFITGGYTNTLSRSYDSHGRPSGISLGDDYTVQYGYDAYGRFNAVTSSVQSLSSVASYSHLSDSDLLSGYTIAGSGDSLSVARSYEAHRDLLTTVDNTVDTTRISRYSYDNNAIGQRMHALNEGLAFAEAGVPRRSLLAKAGDAMNLYDLLPQNPVGFEVRRRPSGAC